MLYINKSFTMTVLELGSLEDITAPGTTLVSYYIPAGKNPGDVSQHVTQELGTAANIKSKTTRKGVQAALRSLQSHLGRIPPNGLAIFASAESYV